MSDPDVPTKEDVLTCLDVLEAAREFYDDEAVTEQLNQAHYTVQMFEETL